MFRALFFRFVDDYAIPLYEPTDSAGERHKRQKKWQRKPYEDRYHGPGWRRRGEPEKQPYVKNVIYQQFDTDVLELARLFSVWFGKGELKRPLYMSAIDRAQQLLWLWNYYDPVDKRLKWKLRKDWQKRLIQAGIDPVTFKIKDLNRWSRVWEMMKCEYRCNLDVIEQDILAGVPAPEYRPQTWSQSLKAQTGKNYNEYGPKPKKGNELVSKSWQAQIGAKMGLGRTETERERRERHRNAGRPDPVASARSIPLTEQNGST